MDRDFRGRFLPGNKVAKGNKGNRYPKWGNKNAVKTGEYETIAYVNEEGCLVISKSGKPVTVMFPPKTFI